MRAVRRLVLAFHVCALSTSLGMAPATRAAPPLNDAAVVAACGAALRLLGKTDDARLLLARLLQQRVASWATESPVAPLHAASVCRLLTQPHGKTPRSTTSAPKRWTASPTKRITPVSLPAVNIHAFAFVAAETIPRSNACCNEEESLKSCAPPVTVMITSGLERPQSVGCGYESGALMGFGEL